MGRLAGIDYGKRRIGIAITDENQVMVLPLKVITIRSMQDGVQQIAKLLSEYSLDSIVIGLPLNMDGSEGPRVAEVKRFTSILAPLFDIPIHFEDERLSSMEAESRLIERNMSRKKRSKVLDAVAAQVILQSFLNLSH